MRIQVGVYRERLEILAGPTAGSLLVSGGWNGDFSSRTEDPTRTVIDADGLGRVLDAQPAGATAVVVENLTLIGGFLALDAGAFGAGARLDPEDSASVALVRVHVIGKTVESTAARLAGGAGVSAGFGDNASVRIDAA